MQKILTKDGSETFYSEQYGDVYHSLTGAVEEALEKFVNPAGIGGLAETGRVRILDICFGMGYNSCAAIDTIIDANPECKISIICLENDPEILEKIQELDPPLKNYKIIKRLAADGSYDKDNLDIRLMIGDARKTILDIDTMFDAVFLDPFSPDKHPDLWQAEFLKEVHVRMKKGALLATYSCARMVRDNLRTAGFEVRDGPRVGRRSPSTIAVKL